MNSHDTAVAIHERAYRAGADKLGISLRPPTMPDSPTLRRCAADVLDLDATDDGSAEVCERAALVMLAGREALSGSTR